jgi:ATP-binding cassette subfamily C protein
MDILKTFFDLLTPRERRNLSLLFCAVLVMVGLEVVSVGSIMPFLQVAADPASVHENAYLSWAYETVGFADTNSFLIALGLGALAALVASNAFIVFTTWALSRYVWGRNHSLSRRLLRSDLYRPYEYFLMRISVEQMKEYIDGFEDESSAIAFNFSPRLSASQDGFYRRTFRKQRCRVLFAAIGLLSEGSVFTEPTYYQNLYQLQTTTVPSAV